MLAAGIAIEIGQIVIKHSTETFAEDSFDVASGLAGGALGAFVALLVTAPAVRARRTPEVFARTQRGSVSVTARLCPRNPTLHSIEGGGVAHHRLLRMGLIAADAEGSVMASESYAIPPVGKTLPMPTWASIVTRGIRDRLPEMRADRTDDRVTWTCAGHVVTLSAERSTWSLDFVKPTGTSAPRHPGVYVDRHDAFTATACAGTMTSVFSAEFCTATSLHSDPTHA